jgi:hypothetical protein
VKEARSLRVTGRAHLLLLLAGAPAQLIISSISEIIDLGMTKTELAAERHRAQAEISQFIQDFSANCSLSRMTITAINPGGAFSVATCTVP